MRGTERHLGRSPPYSAGLHEAGSGSITLRSVSRQDPSHPGGLVDDVGLRALESIHRTLMIDEQWTIRGDRHFTWFAFRLAATIRAGEPVDSLGCVISRVTSTVPVVRNVQIAPQAAASGLLVLNREATGHALVYLPELRLIASVCAHNVHDEVFEQTCAYIAAAHIMALTHAEFCAEGLATWAKGEVARSVHPTSGERRIPDDMMNLIGEHVIPHSSQPNRFADAGEYEATLADLRGSYAYSAGASAEGMSIEIPFGPADTTLIELKATEAHPQLGCGLGIFTTVRHSDTVVALAELANELNRRQAFPDRDSGRFRCLVRAPDRRHVLPGTFMVHPQRRLSARSRKELRPYGCEPSSLDRQYSLPGSAGAVGWADPGNEKPGQLVPRRWRCAIRSTPGLDTDARRCGASFPKLLACPSA